MKRIMQFHIHKDEDFYIAEGVNISIVTQGKTLDELVKNLEEAVSLHFEGEDTDDFGFNKNSPILANLELSFV